MIQLLTGDVRDVLPTLPANSVQCVVTSPPYYGLRDYGTAQWDGGDAACNHVAGNARNDVTPERLAERAALYGTGMGAGSNVSAMQFRDTCGKCGARRIDAQLGLEPTPEAYLATMVAVFREVRRVLRDNGTCWVNLGDSFASGNQPGWRAGNPEKNGGNSNRDGVGYVPGLAAKQLLMMPARLALALQGDGWWLRSDIIWHKPNPMPESVKDRPTNAHEHVFLLTKRSRYYFDQEAVREVAIDTRGSLRFTERRSIGAGRTPSGNERADCDEERGTGRNLRNVWTIATHAYPAAHFATFPPALAERCIKAGSKPGDTILDPFSGAGTALLVADRLGRHAIGIDLSHAYTEMARERLTEDCPLFADLSPPPATEDSYDRPMLDLFATPA